MQRRIGMILSNKGMEDETSYQRKLLSLSLLLEISHALERSMNLNEVLQPVLRLIAEHAGMHRAAITILNRETGQIYIEAAYGLSASQRQKGRYKLGEGITGMVVQSGKPAIIPRISDEPLFLDRTGARRSLDKKDISFICVPIKAGHETTGAFSVDRLFDDSVALEEDMRILTIISSMIAQAAQLRQSAQDFSRTQIRYGKSQEITTTAVQLTNLPDKGRIDLHQWLLPHCLNGNGKSTA